MRSYTRVINGVFETLEAIISEMGDKGDDVMRE